jgi:hypothetical protein
METGVQVKKTQGGWLSLSCQEYTVCHMGVDVLLGYTPHTSQRIPPEGASGKGSDTQLG